MDCTRRQHSWLEWLPVCLARVAAGNQLGVWLPQPIAIHPCGTAPHTGERQCIVVHARPHCMPCLPPLPALFTQA